MIERELQNYLHAHIPLSKAMDVVVLNATLESVTLSAPLAPNINHRATVFGGSASALAILAAWTSLHVRLTRAGIDARVVIQSNTMHYAQPMAGAFTASARAGDAATWQRFDATLSRRRRARITVTATLKCAGVVAGEFTGDFVAFAV